MSEPQREWKEALGDLLAATAAADPHPTPEELVAYRDGELAAGEAGRVQDHLLHCPDCLELFRDAGRFGDPDFGADHEVVEADRAAVWQALRPHLHEASPPSRVVGFRFGAFFRAPLTAYALAASMLLAVVGLALRVQVLDRTVEDLSRPQLDAPIEDLYPPSPLRGEEESGATVRLTPATRWFTLILNPAGSPAQSDYRVEVLDSQGRQVWSGTGLHKTPHGSFTVTFPRRLFGGGDYRVRLYGLSGDEAQLIEEFPLRVLLAGD